MYYFILFLSAIFPIALYGFYIYNKDIHKEPIELLLKLFLGGFMAVILVFIISYFIDELFPYASDANGPKHIYVAYIFGGIAFVEEICKWIFVYLIAFKSPEFDESFDSVIYATFVALGFACFENVLYVFGGGFEIAIMRMVTAIPLHMCVGIFMGSFLSLVKQKKYPVLMMIQSIVVPTMIHGIYDVLCLTSLNNAKYLFYIFIIWIFVYSYIIVNLQSKKNHKI